jgi:cytosine permease
MKIDKILDDYSNTQVANIDRKSWFSISVIIFAAVVTIPVFLLGQTFAYNMNFYDSSIATIIGCFILAIILSLTAYVGSTTNLPTAQICKITFGEIGGKIISLIIGLALIGWFGVTASFFGTSFSGILKDSYNIILDPKIITGIGGLMMMVTAIIGFRGLDKISIIFSPVLLVLLFVLLYKALILPEISIKLSNNGTNAISILNAISIVFGGFAVGIVVAPDLSRYSKRKSDGVIAYILGVLFISPLFIIFTTFLAKVSGFGEYSQIMNFFGWAGLALLILFMASWTTNDNNLYSSSLCFVPIFNNYPKWKLATTLGLIGVFLGVIGVLDKFIPFLTLLGVFIPPIAGVYIADFYVLRKKLFRNLDFDTLSVKSIRKRAFLSWIIACLVGYMTTSKISGGLGLFEITNLSALDSILVAFFSHILFSKIKKES